MNIFECQFVIFVPMLFADCMAHDQNSRLQWKCQLV